MIVNIFKLISWCTRKRKVISLSYITKETKYFSQHNVVESIQDMNMTDTRNIVRKFSLNIDLLILNCNGDINIGMMVRNSFVFGISRVWIVGRKVWDKRTSVGSHHYMDIRYVKSISDTFFEDNNLTPMLIEQNGTNIYDLKWKPFVAGRLCIVMGNERTGIDKNLLDKYPKSIVSIPQVGWTRSLNVSVANGIVLSEMQRYMMKRV